LETSYTLEAFSFFKIRVLFYIQKLFGMYLILHLES
jgi:hypothetical protein